MMKGDGFQPASTRDIRKVAPPLIERWRRRIMKR